MAANDWRLIDKEINVPLMIKIADSKADKNYYQLVLS